MRIHKRLANPVLPGALAGLIYMLIAVATAQRAASAIIGGLVVGLAAVGITFVVRSLFIRPAASHGES